MKNFKHYILFDSHTDGMKLSKHLNESNIKYTFSPTPRQLSVCCGVSIIYAKKDQEEILKIISENKLKYKAFESIEVKSNPFY